MLQAWEAYAKALGYDLLLDGGVDRRLWSSYGRMYISAMKVAMLLATSDWALRPDRPDAPAIQPAHWYQAQAIAEGWRLSAHRLLNECLGWTERSKEDNLLRILRRAGTAGLTARGARPSPPISPAWRWRPCWLPWSRMAWRSASSPQAGGRCISATPAGE